jgi:hypothetical protein
MPPIVSFVNIIQALVEERQTLRRMHMAPGRCLGGNLSDFDEFVLHWKCEITLDVECIHQETKDLLVTGVSFQDPEINKNV